MGTKANLYITMKKKELKDYFNTEVTINIPKGIEMSPYEAHLFISTSIKKGRKYIFEKDFKIERSIVSCGAYQLSNLPTNYYLELLKKVLKRGQIKNFLKAYMREVVDLVQCLDGAFFIVSNNLDSDKTLINETLSSICKTETEWTLNPNSNNMIKVWVL